MNTDEEVMRVAEALVARWPLDDSGNWTVQADPRTVASVALAAVREQEQDERAAVLSFLDRLDGMEPSPRLREAVAQRRAALQLPAERRAR